ncbi:MAG: argininosuccinate synthase [Chitinophagaceae bacterium]|nr:argininosuccinate synthase [Chitinophagaceae bacterium]
MAKKVVLGFSGGLDTSYCVKYLTEEKNYEVHSIIVNTGGFDKDELKQIEEHAYKLGVKTHKTVDAVQNYYDSIIKYLIFGNVLKNNTYPLSVSAERLSQALHIAEHTKELNADAVAHGSTGAGNDQVRFDMVFHIMIPGVEIITPIRDLQLSREEEISYLKEKGVDMNFEKSMYSINKGAAPMVIIKAHHALEKHVLTKWQLQWKDQLAQFYGNWLHEGQILDPVMIDIERFLESSQRNVTGDVFVQLYPYRFQVIGIESKYDLMNSRFGKYGEMNTGFTGDDVRGFSKIFGNQTAMYHLVKEEADGKN